MKKSAESEEFRRYREQMHGTQEEEERQPMANKAMRSIFAIIMIIVYVGVGYLLLANPFGWQTSMWTPTPLVNTMRWIVGVCLILYGCFRAYRYIKGIDG